MDQNELHPDVREFICSLVRLEDILSKHEESFWAEKITRIREVADKSDGNCVELFLGIYGGMGSFNDLVLNAPPSVNELLDLERKHAYSLAQTLK
ncbi:MAG: hypothetical protein AAFN43_02585 [Pseudomonadota bacterium]